ncbi:hypothetical protein ACTXT7_013378 [Hymenolepis weldensis]
MAVWNLNKWPLRAHRYQSATNARSKAHTLAHLKGKRGRKDRTNKAAHTILTLNLFNTLPPYTIPSFPSHLTLSSIFKAASERLKK